MADTCQQDSSLLQLPSNLLHHNVLQHIAVLLPEPAPLALTCHAAAALLDNDGLLLDWALAARDAATTEAHRHPGYELLQWRRLHCMPTPRLVALLLRWVARRLPAYAEASSGSYRRAKQLLEGGDALAALHELLPHSQQLLLLYAAQAGHKRLLGELLAAPGAAAPVRLQWDANTQAECGALQMAATAAVQRGHVEAMHLLLAAMEGSVSSQEQLSHTYAQLLEVGISAGGRSGSCVRALLQLCAAPAIAPHVPTVELPAALPVFEDQSVTDDLLGVIASRNPYAAYTLALRSGLVELLPLLRPDTMTDVQAATHTCMTASLQVAHGGEQHLRLLADAVRYVQHFQPGESCWREAVQAVFWANSIAGLQAIWAAFATPGVSARDRAALACAMLDAIAKTAISLGGVHEAAEWVLQHALPSINSDDALEAGAAAPLWLVGAAAAAQGVEYQAEDGAEELEVVLPGNHGYWEWNWDWSHRDLKASAAKMLLSHGFQDMALKLQGAAAMEDLLAQVESWRVAKLQGEVLLAVRRGDANAVQAALAAFEAAGLEQWHIIGLASCAMQAAAGLADGEAAEAVVRVLAPLFNEHDESLWAALKMPGLLTAHDGSLVRALCDASPHARSIVADYFADSLLCQGALKSGHVGVAEWLCSHPRQRPTYLADVCWPRQHHDTIDCSNFIIRGKVFVRSYTKLLHQLAAGSTRLTHGVERMTEPAAGARQLTAPLLRAVLASGMPDVLHALLVFMDAWAPFNQAA